MSGETSMFQYTVSNFHSDIINTEEFSKNSDELKLLCLLFGGVTVKKESSKEIIQNRNFFIFDNNQDEQLIEEYINNGKLLQSDLTAFRENFNPSGLGTQIKDLIYLIGENLNQNNLNEDKYFDEFFEKEFSTDNVDTETIRKYFIYMNRHNKDYQSTLLSEITLFFFKANIAPTTAFLHLYRVLELISFNIPLVYASKSNDYAGSFNLLKKFFHADGREFSFFKKFLNTLFKDEKEILDLKLQFHIISDNIMHIKSDLGKVYDLKEKRKKDGSKSTLWEFEEEGDNSALCTIPVINMVDFIVSLRNRFFHLSDTTGQPNIKNKTYDMDNVFRDMNFCILNFLSIIILGVSKYSFSTYVRFLEED